MTSEELKAIEERASAAPPGPWHVAGDGEVVNERITIAPGAFTEEALDFIAASRSDVPALCAAVRERDARIAKLEADVETAARQGVMAVLNDGEQEIADLEAQSALTIADNVREMLDHRQREIARLRAALTAAYADLGSTSDARATMVRTGIGIVLDAVPS